MSKGQRKLNEKGLGLLERNLRGKCASAIRAANKVVNKLIPLLKSDNSDLEPVKEYSVELHQYIALIVDTQEEFDSKFAGHLEILASFGEWLQPRFDVLKSVLEYSTAWIDSTTTMSEFHRVLVYYLLTMTLSQKTVFHSCLLLVLAQTDILTRPVNPDLASVNLLHRVMLVPSSRLASRNPWKKWLSWLRPVTLLRDSLCYVKSLNFPWKNRP